MNLDILLLVAQRSGIQITGTEGMKPGEETVITFINTDRYLNDNILTRLYGLLKADKIPSDTISVQNSNGNLSICFSCNSPFNHAFVKLKFIHALSVSILLEGGHYERSDISS